MQGPAEEKRAFWTVRSPKANRRQNPQPQVGATVRGHEIAYPQIWIARAPDSSPVILRVLARDVGRSEFNNCCGI